jgi:hypothetical protein
MLHPREISDRKYGRAESAFRVLLLPFAFCLLRFVFCLLPFAFGVQRFAFCVQRSAPTLPLQSLFIVCSKLNMHGFSFNFGGTT